MSHGEARAFARLRSFLERELDFEAGSYDDAYLERRIGARMRRVGAESYGAYRRRLADAPAERAALLDSLSITVTGFFRNPAAWERLADVLADLTDRRRHVRIWSTPCADGREPYSVAMLAMDTGAVAHQRVEVLGTDINPDALEVARAGRYEASRTTDVAEELAPLSNYRRYVERHGDVFTVRPMVRDVVEFERHDLIRGEPIGEFDLVLCRNLLIYVDAAAKEPVLETVERSLRPGGYLMVGMTETLPSAARKRFEPAAKNHRIYRHT